MALGPPIIALYHQLKTLGVFDGVNAVVELGSQGVWCPHRTMMRELFSVFGQPTPSTALIDDFANGKASARDLYENLGMTYACIDVDERFGSLTLDMNFDEVPLGHRGRYDLTTNHGTSEHILNQSNVFKTMHDLTRPGGLMLHAVPFTVHLEHGFLNYQVDFFSALAGVNSYETLAIWIGPDWQLSSLVPWDPSLFEAVRMSPGTTHLLVVLQRKLGATEFRVPLPGRGRDPAADALPFRDCYVVDGESYDGTRDRFVTAARGHPLRPVSRPPEPATPVVADISVKHPSPDATGDEGLHEAVGPSVISLLRQLKALGVLEGVQSLIELSANSVGCIQRPLTAELFRVFGRPSPSEEALARMSRGASRARELYEALGLTCTSVDLDAGRGTLKLDLNIDPVPNDHKKSYDLAINIGTSEYLLNQLNVFTAVHDFTRPRGFMLHVVPFMAPERAFFGYQPNFFDALARYNSYRTIGTWMGTDSESPTLIPWQPALLEYLVMSLKSPRALVVLLQKMYPTDFCVPFQACYEPLVPRSSLARYRVVVDGEYWDVARAMEIRGFRSLDAVPADEMIRDLVRRIGMRAWHAGRRMRDDDASATAQSSGLRGPLTVSAASGRELAREVVRRVRLRVWSSLGNRFRRAVRTPRFIRNWAAGRPRSGRGTGS
jgi:hypothetical protein